MNENFDAEQTLAAIAAITPTPLETQRALAKVRAALPPRPRRHWMLPLSCAAAIILVATVLLLIFQSHASAAERLAQAFNASRAYKGWVHMTTKTGVRHFNTQTGARAWYGKYYLGKDRVNAGYQNPITRDYATYDSINGLVLLSTLGPNWIQTLHDKAANQPLNYPEFVDFLKTNLDVNLAKVTAKSDGPLQRYDIASAVAATVPAHPNIWPDEDYPSVIWIDPSTGLIAKTQRGGETTTFTYGAPDIRSVYDAGAPRTAAVQDIRPTKEAAAIADRIHARIRKTFPDGVAAFYRESAQTQPAGTYRSLVIRSQSGVNWIEHWYRVQIDSHAEKKLRLPADWNKPGSAGAQEFFRRLAATSPDTEWSGDAQSCDLRDFSDPKQNAHFIGITAQNIAHNKNPAWRLYPLDARYDIGHRLDLITAPDRPGQLGLRVRALAENSPNLERSEDVYWIDPAHADRPVTYNETDYKTPGLPVVDFKSVTEFSDYKDLPAPDTRSYPTQWKTIDYTPDHDGNLLPTGHESTIFCFYPGKTLIKFSPPKP